MTRQLNELPAIIEDKDLGGALEHITDGGEIESAANKGNCRKRNGENDQGPFQAEVGGNAQIRRQVRPSPVPP
jgi:hypothetical protein